MINGKPKPRRVRLGPGAGRRPKNARRARQVPASGLCACSSANYPQACPRDPGISSAASMGDVSDLGKHARSEEHTSELQSLMRTSYAVFCLNKHIKTPVRHDHQHLQSKLAK